MLWGRMCAFKPNLKFNSEQIHTILSTDCPFVKPFDIDTFANCVVCVKLWCGVAATATLLPFLVSLSLWLGKFAMWYALHIYSFLIMPRFRVVKLIHWFLSARPIKPFTVHTFYDGLTNATPIFRVHTNKQMTGICMLNILENIVRKKHWIIIDKLCPIKSSFQAVAYSVAY